jgi:hypothetical protein
MLTYMPGTNTKKCIVARRAKDSGQRIMAPCRTVQGLTFFVLNAREAEDFLARNLLIFAGDSGRITTESTRMNRY